MTRLGIYAGTFDPVHKGHIAFASAAIADCELDTVLFLPEAKPRHKPTVSNIDSRLVLLKKALEHMPQLEVLALECNQFTVESTLSEIQAITGDAALVLLVGSDVLATMHTWPNIRTLLANCELSVGVRHNSNKADVQRHIHNLTEKFGRNFTYSIVTTEHAHLASSQLR